jgi:prepilin-type N-terminal cleavage/methylation domain-containing protein
MQMNDTMRKKGGFSLAEVVIAIAVIVIVSIASIMFIDLSLKTSVEIANKTQAQNFAENALACFKASSDSDEFEVNMSFFLNETFAEGTNDENDFTTYFYEYKSERYEFIAKISVRFDAGGDNFVIEVTRHDEKIIDFKYDKKH